MAERFTNRDRWSQQFGGVLAACAVVLALVAGDSLFNTDSWILVAFILLLLFAISFLAQWPTDIECDDAGLVVVHGRGRGRHVQWTDVIDIEQRTEKRRSGGKHRHLMVSNVLTLRLRDGKPLVLRNMEPRARLENLLETRTGRLTTPRLVTPKRVVLDGTILFDRTQGRGSTITCLLVIVVLCALSGQHARVEATDPNWWWGVVTLLPAGLLAPLFLLLAWGEFGQPAYRLSSSGNTFTVVRRRYGREETTTGEWSRISETRYEIEESPRQRDFTVEAGQPKPLVFRAAEYPELIPWFNERAPLGYEWIPLKSVGRRRVLDAVGDYARVPRE